MKKKNERNLTREERKRNERDRRMASIAMLIGAVLYMGGQITEYKTQKPQQVTYREYIDTLDAGLDTEEGKQDDLIDTVYYDPNSDYWRYTLWTEESKLAYETWIEQGKSPADFQYQYDKSQWREFEMPDYTNDGLQAHIEKYDGLACREIVKQNFQPFWLHLLGSYGETLILLAFLGGFAYFMTKSVQRIDGVNEKNILVEDTGVKFSDVIGHDEIIDDLQLIVRLMQKKQSEKKQEKGKFPVQIPRGMLFSGEAGTGKTLLAKAVAGEAGVPFFYMNASGFVEMYVGVGAKRVRQLFKIARKNAPCIIFIDEIDAVGTDRNSASISGEQKQTINALLQEMDGFDTKAGVFIIAATNNPEKLDKALVRSGRFDRQVVINPPRNWEVRKRLFEHYLQQEIEDNMCSANLEQVSKQSVGFTGADISAICNEARLIAIAKDSNDIDTDILEEAIDRKIFKGNHVKEREKHTEEIKVVAYHEAGHALVNALLHIPIARATIIGTTGGTGGAVFREDEMKMMQSKQDLQNFVKVAFGGRAAEEVIFGTENITTGASNDLMKVTEILKSFVRTYAFDETKIVMTSEESMMNPQLNDYVFERINVLSNAMYQETVSMIQQHKDKLEQIAQLLLEKETISGDEIYQIVKGES